MDMPAVQCHCVGPYEPPSIGHLRTPKESRTVLAIPSSYTGHVAGRSLQPHALPCLSVILVVVRCRNTGSGEGRNPVAYVS